jgi:hypothetical protein
MAMKNRGACPSRARQGGPLLDGLRSHEGVIDAEMVTGPYDVIARVRVGRPVKVLDEARSVRMMR